MSDNPISPELNEKIVNFLEKEIPKYDLTVVGDFGHGFFRMRG